MQHTATGMQPLPPPDNAPPRAPLTSLYGRAAFQPSQQPHHRSQDGNNDNDNEKQNGDVNRSSQVVGTLYNASLSTTQVPSAPALDTLVNSVASSSRGRGGAGNVTPSSGAKSRSSSVSQSVNIANLEVVNGAAGDGAQNDQPPNDDIEGTGTEVPVGSKKYFCALENIPLWMLFSQLDIKLNGTQVNTTSNLYPVRCYLETMLSHTARSKHEQLITEGYFKDTAKYMDPSEENCLKNVGFQNRGKLIAESRYFELYGRIHADILNISKLIPNNVDIELTFYRSKVPFSMSAWMDASKTRLPHAPGAKEYDIELQDVSVQCERFYVDSDEMARFETRLLHETAKYQIVRTQLYTYVLPEGLTNKTIDSLFGNQIPKRITMCMNTNTAMSGNLTKNPLNFQHFDITRIALFRDGDAMQPWEMKFSPISSERRIVQAYTRMFEGLNLLNADIDTSISINDFANGYCFFVMDLTNDGNASSPIYLNPVNYGDIRMELTFGTPTPEPINVMLFCEYDGVIQMDRSRNFM